MGGDCRRLAGMMQIVTCIQSFDNGFDFETHAGSFNLLTVEQMLMKDAFPFLTSCNIYITSRYCHSRRPY